MKAKHLFVIVLIVFIFKGVMAQVPETISHQGILKNADGTLVSNDTYSLTFSLYDVETGGDALWTETQSVTVTDGVYNAILGGSTPLAVAFDQQYWLEIRVGAETLTPRTKLTSVPFSLNTRSIADNTVTTAIS